MTESCRCDGKKCLVSVLIAAVGHGVMSFVIHEAILGPHYKAYASLFNPALMRSRAPFFALAHLAWGAAFACIYARGYEADRAPLGQGLRFGVWAWLLATVPWATVSYVIYPYSGRLIGAWIGLELVECLFMGSAVALAYRPKTQA